MQCQADKIDGAVAGMALDPVGLLVVQPTPFCNINCSYCYLAARSETKRMATKTVRAIARFIHDVPVAKKPLSLVWHAGEPLVVPISFYEGAFQCFASDPNPIPLQYHIQTNGTLINDAWCSFFRKWDVRIGLSIDGPKAIHDASRVDRSGRGTFDRVMRGVAKLREHNISFSVITVLTRTTLEAPDDLWKFLKSLGATRVGFNVEETEGVHHTSSLRGNEQVAVVHRFMSRIADLQANDQHAQMRIRELEDMRHHLAAPPGSQTMRSDNRPGAIINIDVDGNVTTFSPELLGMHHPRYGRFSWANVHTNSWFDLVNSPGFQRAQSDIVAGVELCRQSCPYFSVCGGGCPSNKLAELGSFATTETQTCRLHVQVVADVVIERVERELELGVGT